jgi:excisionase family DNA binding protein
MSAALWNVREVAQHLGLAPVSVYRLVRRGRLPAARVGGRWRFVPDEIAAWLRSNHRGPTAEAEEGIALLRKIVREWRRIDEPDLNVGRIYMERRRERWRPR